MPIAQIGRTVPPAHQDPTRCWLRSRPKQSLPDVEELAVNRAIATSLAVSFTYGSLVWGVLPTPFGVSWETHLAAVLIGATLAIALRRLDVPPPKRYAWEGEAGESDGVDPALRPEARKPGQP